MYPVDVDYGDEVATKLLDSDIESNLEKPVQDLIRLIFERRTYEKSNGRVWNWRR